MTSANLFEGESVEEQDKLGNSKESEVFIFKMIRNLHEYNVQRESTRTELA